MGQTFGPGIEPQFAKARDPAAHEDLAARQLIATFTGVNTIWILGDQLSPEHAALSQTKPGAARVLMIESKARGAVHRFHQVKLVLVYSAMRHFAADLRAQGWEVDYRHLEEGLTFATGLERHLAAHRPEKVLLAEPNSFFETDALTRLGRKLRVSLEFLPTTQFLVARGDFRAWASGARRLLMENHYRRQRKRFGWLLDEKSQPVGGAWNFDPENRATFATWKRAGRPHAATTPQEEPMP